MSTMTTVRLAYETIKRINLFLGYVAGCAVAALTAVTMFEMLSRFLFNQPTTWTLDISRYLLLVIGVLSLSYTMQEDGHVYFSIVVDHVSERLRRVIAVIGTCFVLVFCGILGFYSIKLSFLSYKHGWGTMAHASIPQYYQYGVISLAAVLLCITSILKTILDISLSKNDREGL